VTVLWCSLQAGEVEALELAMYSTMMVASTNVQMVEYLMAGMWILLRQPSNRKVLGQALSGMGEGANANTGLLDTLDDAIVVHDVTQEVRAVQRLTGGGVQGGTQPLHNPCNLQGLCRSVTQRSCTDVALAFQSFTELSHWAHRCCKELQASVTHAVAFATDDHHACISSTYHTHIFEGYFGAAYPPLLLHM
jgi:hypothetical protein